MPGYHMVPTTNFKEEMAFHWDSYHFHMLFQIFSTRNPQMFPLNSSLAHYLTHMLQKNVMKTSLRPFWAFQAGVHHDFKPPAQEIMGGQWSLTAQIWYMTTQKAFTMIKMTTEFFFVSKIKFSFNLGFIPFN